MRVAVIGRTGRGNYGHGLDSVWKLIPNAQVVAVADDNPQGLRAAGERLGVKALYPDYTRMLRQERPEIVAVAPRWVDCHHDMVLAAAEAHASIYMEKPMARTPAECDAMLDACDRAHVKLAVAHQMRISPILDLARKRVAEGAIGDVLELRGRGKEDRRAGGEDLMVLGTHVMDLLRQFAGDPAWAAARVTTAGRDIGRADVREGPEGLGPIAGDAASAMFAFKNGITGYFASKRSSDTSGAHFGLEIIGSTGRMTIAAGFEPEVRINGERLALPGNPPPRDTNAANLALVLDLFEAIRRDRPPRASGAEARWTIEMVMSVYEAQLTGARVPFPLKRRTHPLAAAKTA